MDQVISGESEAWHSTMTFMSSSNSDLVAQAETPLTRLEKAL
jgi:hypothetical protein